MTAAVVLSLISLFQAPPLPRTFDVASIKPVKDCVQRLPRVSAGSVILECVDVRYLVRVAYGTRPGHFPLEAVGGPAWVDSEKYQIAAKAEATPTNPEMTSMLQKLLEERFSLKVHKETRQAAVYELTIAKGGPKLRPAKDRACVPGPTFTCGVSTRTDGAVWTEEAENVSMGEFADGLATGSVARPVIDKTRLKGRYDFELEFTPERMADADDAGPSVFAALQEQLGLKLTPAKGPVDVLVIDHVQKPSEN